MREVSLAKRDRGAPKIRNSGGWPMNGLAPPKAKRRLWRTAFRSLELGTAYRVAAILATTFGWP